MHFLCVDHSSPASMSACTQNHTNTKTQVDVGSSVSKKGFHQQSCWDLLAGGSGATGDLVTNMWHISVAICLPFISQYNKTNLEYRMPATCSRNIHRRENRQNLQPYRRSA